MGCRAGDARPAQAGKATAEVTNEWFTGQLDKHGIWDVLCRSCDMNAGIRSLGEGVVVGWACFLDKACWLRVCSGH